MISATDRRFRMRPADGELGREAAAERSGENPGGLETGRDRLRIGRTGPHFDRAKGFDVDALDQLSKDELYEIAKGLKIEGRCRMSRDQLLAVIRERGRA